jgi:hypothetical protein
MKSLRITLCINILLAAWGCASVRQRNEITALNQVFTIPGKQQLFVFSKGKVVSKTLPHRAKAALYEKGDTLYAEFIANSLRPDDKNPSTIDQTDSLSTLFVHYNPVLNKLQEKSPWFRYKTSGLDIDLVTMPLQYHFATDGLPGQLNDYPLNFHVHIGLLSEIGRYRTTYFRRNRRSEIQSFSFGIGGLIGLSPMLVNSFNTNGAVPDEYQALGINYGLSSVFSFKSISAGFALGYSKLTDRNDPVWVYNNQPWLGLTLGINLN